MVSAIKLNLPFVSDKWQEKKQAIGNKKADWIYQDKGTNQDSRWRFNGSIEKDQSFKKCQAKS